MRSVKVKETSFGFVIVVPEKSRGGKIVIYHNAEDKAVYDAIAKECFNFQGDNAAELARERLGLMYRSLESLKRKLVIADNKLWGVYRTKVDAVVLEQLGKWDGRQLTIGGSSFRVIDLFDVFRLAGWAADKKVEEVIDALREVANDLEKQIWRSGEA